MKQMQEEYSKLCHCGKRFNFLIEFKIHQKTKHQSIDPSFHPNLNHTSSSDSEPSQLQNTQGANTKNNQPDKHIEIAIGISSKPSEITQQNLPYLGTKQVRQSRIDFQEQVFLCGCNHKKYQNKAELSTHFKKIHHSLPPDGSLIGVSKKRVVEIFKEKTQGKYGTENVESQPYN